MQSHTPGHRCIYLQLHRIHSYRLTNAHICKNTHTINQKHTHTHTHTQGIMLQPLLLHTKQTPVLQTDVGRLSQNGYLPISPLHFSDEVGSLLRQRSAHTHSSHRSGRTGITLQMWCVVVPPNTLTHTHTHTHTETHTLQPRRTTGLCWRQTSAMGCDAGTCRVMQRSSETGNCTQIS